MPTPRRRPWGHLWAAAPWDGKARAPEPLRIPATDAALIDTPAPLGTLSLKRRPWGRLFALAPWTRRATPARSPEVRPMPVADLFAALPPAPSEPASPSADDDSTGGVDFNFEPADDASSTMRLAPPPEVMS